MKTKATVALLFLVLSFIGCKKDNGIVQTRMIVDHYQGIGNLFGPYFILRTQTDDKIGTSTWEYSWTNIEGFNYEEGYVYDLIVQTKKIENPPQDGGSYSINLVEIKSKTKVSTDTRFDVPLRQNQQNFITDANAAQPKILNQKAIDCGTLCTELSQNLASSKATIIGTFQRKADGVYLLKELK